MADIQVRFLAAHDATTRWRTRKLEKMMKHSQYCPCKGQPVPNRAHTANGVEIRDGLRVFTNNLDKGVVNLSNAEWEWHHGEQKHHLWFDVDLDTSYTGIEISGREMQSDDRVTTRFDGRQA